LAPMLRLEIDGEVEVGRNHAKSSSALNSKKFVLLIYSVPPLNRRVSG